MALDGGREEFNVKHISVFMACSNAAQSLQYSSRLLHSTIHDAHYDFCVSHKRGVKCTEHRSYLFKLLSKIIDLSESLYRAAISCQNKSDLLILDYTLST